MVAIAPTAIAGGDGAFARRIAGGGCVGQTAGNAAGLVGAPEFRGLGADALVVAQLLARGALFIFQIVQVDVGSARREKYPPREKTRRHRKDTG
jgi:hypothetical protein